MQLTGRVEEKRRWSDGLHQAVEAKEGVKIQVYLWCFSSWGLYVTVVVKLSFSYLIKIVILFGLLRLIQLWWHKLHTSHYLSYTRSFQGWQGPQKLKYGHSYDLMKSAFLTLPPILYVKLDLPPVFIIVRFCPLLAGNFKELHKNEGSSQKDYIKKN